MNVSRKNKHFVRPTLLLLTLSHVALCQSTTLSENCDLSVLGATETKSFLAFERELQKAVKEQDAGMLSLLTLYPLRVNDGHGSYYVHDAGSLQRRFEEIFTPAIRDAIAKQVPATLMCNANGVMYGDGVVWIVLDDERYGVQTVNLPLALKDFKPSSGTLGFECYAEKHRVIVDAGADGNPRYRSWNKPRSLIDKPDLEIDGGAQNYEGTGPWRHILWTFTSGSTKFVVEELGCDPDAPKDSTGRLTVSQPGKADVNWWCR